MAEEPNDFNTGSLSGSELLRLRQMMRADDRARWFWSSLRTGAIWAASVMVGILAAKSFILDWIHK